MHLMPAYSLPLYNTDTIRRMGDFVKAKSLIYTQTFYRYVDTIKKLDMDNTALNS